MTTALSKICLIVAAGLLSNFSTPSSERYVTTTPCHDAIRTLHNIPAGADCSTIKWDLVLFTEKEKKLFSMKSEWGFYINNQTLEKRGEAQSAGTWTSKQSDGIESVTLNADNGITFSFRRLDANHLHLLDNNRLAVGNGGYSFTLNKSSVTKPESKNITTGSATAKESFTKATFVGRTPCKQIASEAGISVDAACFKLKWKLTLYQDSVTKLPAYYEMSRIQYRATPLTGKWKIITARINGRNETCYQLDPDKPGTSITFMKGDDSVLFFTDRHLNLLPGDDEFAYTLNRR